MSQDKRIIFTRPDGGVSVIIPAPGVPFERVLKDVPADSVSAKVVDVADLPTDRTLRNAWCPCPERGVSVDVDKARDIAHDCRRSVRSKRFQPLDVQATIPLFAAAAEEQRQVIRDADAIVQGSIDSAENVEALLQLVKTL